MRRSARARRSGEAKVASCSPGLGPDESGESSSASPSERRSVPITMMACTESSQARPRLPRRATKGRRTIPALPATPPWRRASEDRPRSHRPPIKTAWTRRVRRMNREPSRPRAPRHTPRLPSRILPKRSSSSVITLESASSAGPVIPRKESPGRDRRPGLLYPRSRGWVNTKDRLRYQRGWHRQR